MPWWAILYATFYFLLTVVGDIFMFKQRTSTAYWLTESITHFGVGILLVGCWLTGIPQTLGWFAMLFFAFAIVWEIVSGPDKSETAAGEAPSALEKAFNVGLTVIFIGPAYVGAAVAAYHAVT